MKGKQLAYRPDIDGLRGLAVILVLLFHFELGVSGGFIGVDVFFVISGYLITEVIRNSINAGRFTFSDFYVRRLLRLHPALLVTLAATLGAGFLLMDPASFVDLSTSAKYAVFSASNFYYWLNQGYFDAASQTKPLLHTWSLAAEWQFYLVWPFIVWAALKVSDRALLCLLAVLVIVSLAASQLMLGRDSSAAYFMMPFRVFELAIGALLVFAPAKRPPSAAESAIALTGIAAIISSAFLLTSDSAFPGVAALLPCLGAAACIYAGRSPAGYLLRIRPMVFIGLISYSVYLVHWPLVVFYKYYVFREATLNEKLVLLAAAIALGAALYYMVEKLFMAKRPFIKPVGISAIIASCLVAVYGCNAVIASGGITSRIPAEYLSFSKDPASFHLNNYGGHGYALDAILGAAGGKRLAVIAGDSFALQYSYGIDAELSGSGGYIEGVFQHGCVLSGEYTRLLNNAPRQICRDKYQAILDKLHGNNLPLIFTMNWSGYVGKVVNSKNEPVGVTQEEYKQFLTDMLSKIRKDAGSGRTLILIGAQPLLSSENSTISCLLRPRYISQVCEHAFDFSEPASATRPTNNEIANFAANNANTFYLDPAQALCTEGVCSTIDSGAILYSDGSHLSKDGSIKVSRKIVPDIIKMSADM